MHRTEFRELTTEQQEAFITQLQHRRLEPIRRYKELMARKREVRDAKLAAQIAKQIELVEKSIAAWTKAEEAMTTRYTKLRALILLSEAD